MSDEPKVDFRELLNKPMSDFPDLPDLPGAKHFYGKLTQMSAGYSKNKGTPLYRFDVRLTDPGEDVPKAAMDAIAEQGFNLADYQSFAEFYITPNAMRMFRRFIQSLGFNPSISFVEALKLNPTTAEPTSETQDLIRGIDVLVRTPAADENNRVYSRLDQIAGTKRA